MVAKQDKQPGDSKESEVWNAISAFEQILEAIPNDRTSIETLAHAYEQIGDLSRARDYTIRLANLVLTESDHEGARSVLPKLEVYAASDADAKKTVQRIQAFLADKPAQRPAAPAVEHVAAKHPEEKKPAQPAQPAQPATKHTAPLGPAPAAGTRTTFNIASELPFAWNLLKANEITQDEYSSVVQDLTDMSATDATVTVSVLHVLHDRGFKNLAKIMTTVAKECGTPIISLSNFELQSAAFTLLPLEFMIKRGAIIFDFFGSDALCVVMNPYDKPLLKAVESMAGRKCFFYLTAPAEFDAAISKVNGWLEQQSREANA